MFHTSRHDHGGRRADPGRTSRSVGTLITMSLGPTLHLPAAVRLIHDACLFGDAFDQTGEELAVDIVLPALDDLGIGVVDT